MKNIMNDLIDLFWFFVPKFEEQVLVGNVIGNEFHPVCTIEEAIDKQLDFPYMGKAKSFVWFGLAVCFPKEEGCVKHFNLREATKMFNEE